MLKLLMQLSRSYDTYLDLIFDNLSKKNVESGVLQRLYEYLFTERPSIQNQWT